MQFLGINVGQAIGRQTDMISNLVTMQKAAADNIANVDTPGYRPKHYDFATFLSAEHSAMETPLSARMGASHLPELLYTSSAEEKVNLQDEFMAMQKNLLYFSVVSKRLSTTITNIRTASQVGR